MQEARQGPRRTPRTIAGKTHPVANAAQQQALQHYQMGLQLMQEGKFDKARTIFEKLVNAGPNELTERSRVYLTACDRNVQAGRAVVQHP